MTLFNLAYIKSNFPEWESFVKRNAGESAEDVDDRLTLIGDNAEALFQEFVPLTDPDLMTAPLKLHLLNIVRKGCFDVKNSANAYEHKPQIIRDYEFSLGQLEKYRAGLLEKPLADGATDGQLDVRMAAGSGTYDEWFNGE